MPGGLHTDLYELNMAASYLRRDMNAPATFSLYVRGLPKTRGFLVAAGLESCLDFLESFSFTDDELEALGTMDFDDRAIADFSGLRFAGDVWAVPEGRIVYSEEPLLEVTAPVAVAQVVETMLLNQITLHTTLASKAARYVLAADGRQLVDFAFRRTHGVEAAMAIARASALVGFAATSNVEAARRYGLVVAGTMAHSFVEAFPTEVEAFRAFAEDHPGRTTFLVDTYDTLAGVRAAIDTIRDLELGGDLGVRLDSGDLDALARAARTILDEAGLDHARIFASGGLDELEVHELVSAGAPVDAFGIGTQMGVSADAPYVDSVYKLVEYGGRPVMKLSSDKVSPPGRKQVWRSDGERGDLLALRDEPGPDGAEPLLEPVMRGGKRSGGPISIEAARRRFEADLAHVPQKARRLTHPERVTVTHSDALLALTDRTRAEAERRSGIAR
ncbi:MAG TPA: nicotinate phosphoribosyltransferase [Actinomycetota bacterium]|nr:nicotinate phosphoribosyltransferase [Actinomycetota bacterium]